MRIPKDEYRMEKLKHLQKDDLRYMQKYMANTSLDDSRLEFRYRTRMLNNRANMGKRYSFKNCPHCPAGRQEGVLENNQHWMECSAYEDLRRGMDPELVLKDRVTYLRRVQMLRDEMEKTVKN